IYGADAVLHLVKIRSHINYKIVRPHIAQKTYKAPLIELYKFFGKAYYILPFLSYIVFQKLIAGNAGSMLFHKRIFVYQIQHFVWRKHFLQFQAIHPAGICTLYIVIIVIVV